MKVLDKKKIIQIQKTKPFYQLPKVIFPLMMLGSFCISAIAANGNPQLATLTIK
jgi:hypothetical protein